MKQNLIYYLITIYLLDENSETFTAVVFQVEAFCVVTPSGVVLGYQRFKGPCCLHLQHGPLKRWYPTKTQHGITTQKTSKLN
jgi:hypothetical protein